RQLALRHALVPGRRPARRRRHAATVLCASLHLHSCRRLDPHDRAFLAHPERRRHLGATLMGEEETPAAAVPATTKVEAKAEVKAKEISLPNRIHTWPYLVRLEF